MPELHFLVLLFGTNLVRKILIKTLKNTKFNALLALFWSKKDADLMHILVGCLTEQPLLSAREINIHSKHV